VAAFSVDPDEPPSVGPKLTSEQETVIDAAMKEYPAFIDISSMPQYNLEPAAGFTAPTDLTYDTAAVECIHGYYVPTSRFPIDKVDALNEWNGKLSRMRTELYKCSTSQALDATLQSLMGNSSLSADEPLRAQWTELHAHADATSPMKKQKTASQTESQTATTTPMEVDSPADSNAKKKTDDVTMGGTS
jgi:hypothetical protein